MNMTWDAVLDSVEAVALIIIASVLSLAFWMMRREFLSAGRTLRQVLQSQQALLDELASVGTRTEENTADIRALKAEREGRRGSQPDTGA